MAETTAMMVEPDPSREVPACEALVCHTYIPGHARAFCARSGEQRAATAGICGVERAELGEAVSRAGEKRLYGRLTAPRLGG